MKFGIIGTGKISGRFIQCGNLCEGFEAYALLSRNADSDFAKKHGIGNVYTSLEMMAKDEEIQAVYIASPNSFHYSQAIAMLNAKKHVLCEKPVCSNEDELKEILSCAGVNGKVFMEAMRPPFNPSMQKLKELIANMGQVRGAKLSFSRYSSRYDRYKMGETLNTFDPTLSNSALMDMGVYCVAMAIELFGMPKSVSCKDHKLSNGFMAGGMILAQYEDMVATIDFSKIATSYAQSEIFFEDGSILIDNLDYISGVTVITKDGKKDAEFLFDADEMRHEIASFMDYCKTKVPECHTKRTQDTMQILDEAHAQCGIRFVSNK